VQSHEIMMSSACVGSPNADHSRFVQRIRRRYEAERHWLPAGVPDAASLRQTWQTLRAHGHDVPAALRIVRHLTIERLAVLDCEQGVELSAITHAMTALAELVLDEAARAARAELDAIHGPPQAGPQRAGTPLPPDLQAEPGRCGWWIVGMGKLGARELNVSSDIDLIYIYETDGETRGDAQGRQRITNHEYFAKLVKRMQALISEVTEHGQAFRVDLALRPNGNSGPPAVPLGALEDYFQAHGREWERFAWLKSRVVAPADSACRDGSGAWLRPVVLPFVFRRYLDYAVFDALRRLHQQIREHAVRRAAGHPERAHDVKLSRGGIREIEFIVQLLQVVRGGQFPELRTRPTLQALQRVADAGLMPADKARQLADAYVFLRRVEHRIQYLDDQQTHILPTRDDDLLWIAHTLGFDGIPAFLSALDAHREVVAHEFDTLLGGHGKGGCVGKGCHGSRAEPDDLSSLLPDCPPALAERLQPWIDHPRVLALRDEARQRLVRLLQRTVAWIDDGRVAIEAAVRLVDWIEPLLRRESYLALLQERPAVHERLLRVLGAARWPARYLLRHPGVIDELASAELYATRFDPQAFMADLEARRWALHKTGEDDDEALLDLLRRAHHAEVFRTLARDVEGLLTVEQVADDLSALADAVLDITGRWCWQRLKSRHRDEPRHAIIGYGKLGGKELGYGSDLDIVFVYDDDDERAPEVYAAYVRKLINWLTVKTGEGDLFEIDTALRPNGNSGLLVTSFTAFENYQQNRGSNTAWTWEHQAMTRARFVVGAPDLRARFDAVREAVITAERDHAALAAEIRTMRQRLYDAHPVRAGRFDLKHSPGGMIDVEFAVQYLVLAHSRAHPALRDNAGNIALLQRAEAAGLLPAGVGLGAADAYRRLRQLQHRARLDDASTQVDPDSVRNEAQAVRTLWTQVLGEAPR
jgi:glutamate-ammonia-ligase adenylyltransferase